MPPLVLIIGPTGAGKTGLAVALARTANAEIVSADSQQVYVGMDIGTGKATEDERGGVRHHLIDILTPDEQMTAARFVDLADAAIADIHGRDRCVVVAGGTMLYIRALLKGLFDGPPASEAVRERLANEAQASGEADYLARRLRDVDPDAAERIDWRDHKRIVRALEVYELTGEPISVHQRRHNHDEVPLRYPARLIGLAPEREELYRKIETRVDAMVEAGLVAEVAALREAGFTPPMRSQTAIGYGEIHRHLDGDIELADAIALIKKNSRRYARRQLSWYRSDKSVCWHTKPSEVDLDELRRYLSAPTPAGR